MANCGKHQITKIDVAHAISNIEDSFTQLKSDHLLPTNAELTIEKSAYGMANVDRDTAHVTADPVALSCLNKKQILAVMAHETGHYNDPHLITNTTSIEGLGQLALLTGVGGVMLLRLIKAVAFRLMGHVRPFHIHDQPFIRVLLIAHEINGFALAKELSKREFTADAFAVQVVGSGDTVATALQKSDTYEPGGPNSANGENIKPLKIASILSKEVALVGVVGYLNDHPGVEERMAAARATVVSGSIPKPHFPSSAVPS